MNKKTSLSKDLEKIFKGINITVQAFEFCNYLNFPKIDGQINEEHSKYISNSGFFLFTRYSLWRTTIIELHKLLNDNKETDKFNLHHLIKKFHRGGFYSSLSIEEVIIEKWENDLNSISGQIEEIKLLRLKSYAHTDKNFQDLLENSKLTLEEIEKVINTVLKIVFDLNQIVFGKHISFLPVYSKKSLQNIINDILIKRKNDRKNAFQKFIKETNDKTRDNDS